MFSGIYSLGVFPPLENRSQPRVELSASWWLSLSQKPKRTGAAPGPGVGCPLPAAGSRAHKLGSPARPRRSTRWRVHAPSGLQGLSLQGVGRWIRGGGSALLHLGCRPADVPEPKDRPLRERTPSRQVC